ncbi:thioesterase II family protein [Streptomyces sp. NPDC001848]|uniref:thioesterase II family protein n=1 Tax=Streptomyces sp. NPDC001848 TaxID=3364618 RepID=UPI00368860A0
MTVAPHRKELYDVAVLGSGTAGGTLGAVPGRNGVNVLLLDAGTHPRSAVGESTIPYTSGMTHRGPRDGGRRGRTGALRVIPFIRPRPLQDPAVRLVVCPHAGGSGSAYFPLARLLPDDWDVLLLDLPGRGKRHSAEPLRDMTAVAALAAGDIAPWAGPSLALFGHSMGAVVAVEAARLLQDRGLPPTWVGVSGRLAPPDVPPSPELDPALPDDELMAGLAAMGGIPDRFDEVPEFRRRFLRVVRADLEALGRHRPDPARSPLAAPLTAFGAAGDDLSSSERLGTWAAETARTFRRHTFEGGHFHFLQDGFAALARVLTAEVRHALWLRQSAVA